MACFYFYWLISFFLFIIHIESILSLFSKCDANIDNSYSPSLWVDYLAFRSPCLTPIWNRSLFDFHYVNGRDHLLYNILWKHQLFLCSLLEIPRRNNDVKVRKCRATCKVFKRWKARWNTNHYFFLQCFHVLYIIIHIDGGENKFVNVKLIIVFLSLTSEGVFFSQSETNRALGFTLCMWRCQNAYTQLQVSIFLPYHLPGYNVAFTSAGELQIFSSLSLQNTNIIYSSHNRPHPFQRYLLPPTSTLQLHQIPRIKISPVLRLQFHKYGFFSISSGFTNNVAVGETSV